MLLKNIKTLSLFITASLFFWPNIHAQDSFWEEVIVPKTYVGGQTLGVNNKGTLIMLFHGRSHPLIARSTDDGTTWEDVSPVSRYVAASKQIVPIDDWIYIFGYHGVFVSKDDGKTWEDIGQWENNRGPYRFIDPTTIYDHDLYNQDDIFNLYAYENFNWNKVKSINTPDLFTLNFDGKSIPCGIEGLPYADIQGGTFYKSKQDGLYYSSTPREDRTLGANFGVSNIYCYDPNSTLYANPFMKRWLYYSKDRGNTWQELQATNIKAVHEIITTCQEGQVIIRAHGTDDIRANYYITQDDGQSWRKLFDTPGDKEMRNVFVSPNGRIYFQSYNKFYRSVEKLPCAGEESEVPERDYGTTVITHGLKLGSSKPFGEEDWLYEMAYELLKKAENGRILGYDKTTGALDELAQMGDAEKGENIILFDWVNESNIPEKGYAEAAADALFAALLMHEELNLDSLHFIGHSRGTVVNTLVVERLLTIKDLYSKRKITIDQVTNIDAHDWGAFDIGSDIDDAHPEIKSRDPISTAKNNGTIAWKGVTFNDSYYQDGGISDLAGRRVEGTENYHWDEGTLNTDVTHTDIHGLYTLTINVYPDAHLVGGGFHFARLNNTLETRATYITGANGELYPSFKFFENLNFEQDGIAKSRVQGLMNGSFDRGEGKRIPGWTDHGGTIGEGGVRIEKEELVMEDFIGIAPLIRHNRFYVPKDASAIKFLLKSASPNAGTLSVFMLDELLGTQHVNGLESEFKEVTIPVPEAYKDNVVTLQFEFNSTSGSNAKIIIDEVQFVK